MPEELQIRIYGDASRPTLVYLPGLHGDWTLVGAFRKSLGSRVRFVEVTYPRTLNWSLDDYAAAVEAMLREKGVDAGWLLGESFSSQVVWPMVNRKHFRIQGVILAGGFVRHPMCWAARVAGQIAGGMPLGLLTRILFSYAWLARLRYRNSPDMPADLREFVARRTELDRQAAKHRLQLLARSDFRPVAETVQLPVFAISGALDPIVPWIFVRPWLRRHCVALREYRVVWAADHNVLSTAAQLAADQVVQWINQPKINGAPASGATKK
jgi:pimeloyl-ACP methyl ester carboxylesterase